MVQIKLGNHKAVLTAFVFLLLKKLEGIDNSVIDRYSLIVDLWGNAERFVLTF